MPGLRILNNRPEPSRRPYVMKRQNDIHPTLSLAHVTVIMHCRKARLDPENPFIIHIVENRSSRGNLAITSPGADTP